MVQLVDGGVYHLAADVANPHPDRRKKNWQDKPSYPAGYYKAQAWADNSAGRRADHLGLVPCHEDGNALEGGILHRVAWPEQYDLLLSKLAPACKQVCGERQVYYRPAGPGVQPIQEVRPFNIGPETLEPAPDSSLLGSLHRLLDFVVNGERYESRNPYTLDVVKSVLAAYKRATDTEHSLRQMHKLTLHSLGRSVQTLIEDAILAGLTPADVTAELAKLCGYNPHPAYADLVPCLAQDLLASSESEPTPEEVEQYFNGLRADVVAALTGPRHVGDICPACRGAVLEDESETLKAGCPACGRAFTLAADDPHHR